MTDENEEAGESRKKKARWGSRETLYLPRIGTTSELQLN